MTYSREARRLAEDSVSDVRVLRRLTLVSLAGAVSESMHVHADRWSLRDLDVQGFRASGGSIDLENAQIFCELAADDDPARAGSLLRWGRLIAASKLFRHRDAVHDLAAELQRHGSLNGREVETILTTGGYLPRRTLDPDRVVTSGMRGPETLRQWAKGA